jgi:excisionase family DNA binding protein
MLDTNLLTKEEKAKEMGVSKRTIDRWIKKEKITVINVPKSKRRWFLPSVVDDAN